MGGMDGGESVRGSLDFLWFTIPSSYLTLVFLDGGFHDWCLRD